MTHTAGLYTVNCKLRQRLQLSDHCDTEHEAFRIINQTRVTTSKHLIYQEAHLPHGWYGHFSEDLRGVVGGGAVWGCQVSRSLIRE